MKRKPLRKITAELLHNHHLGICLGDIVLLPRPLSLDRHRWAAGQLASLSLLEDIPVDAAAKLEDTPFSGLLYINYRDEYVDYCGNPCEAPWWNGLPDEIQADFMFFYYSHRCSLHGFNIPFCSISYGILEDGFIDDVVHELGVHRLSQIRQLGYLTDPITYYADGASSIMTILEHNRLTHSIDVLAIGTIIAHNAGVRGRALRNLQFALLTHDILTPAGGDSTKRVSAVELDEDGNFALVFDLPGFDQLERTYNLVRPLILKTIRNEGFLGMILDIADKLAYVSRDLPCYLTNVEPGDILREKLPNEFFKITAIAERCPNLSTIWECFDRVGDRLVCSDPARLTDFLSVRLLLFRQFYANPASRFHEATTVRLALEYLVQSGKLTINRLRTMFDWDLDPIVGKVLGNHYWYAIADALGKPCFATFTTEQRALAHAQTLIAAGKFPLLTEDLQPYMKRSSKKFTVRDPNGVLTTLDKGYPVIDAELLEIERLPEPWALYWYDSLNGSVSRLFRQIVENNLRTRFLPGEGNAGDGNEASNVGKSGVPGTTSSAVTENSGSC